MAVHIKVLEGNAGDIHLVHVHDLLQPLPHLVLTPELRLGVTRPQATCVTRHHHWNWRQTSKVVHENILKKITALVYISEFILFYVNMQLMKETSIPLLKVFADN